MRILLSGRTPDALEGCALAWTRSLLVAEHMPLRELLDDTDHILAPYPDDTRNHPSTAPETAVPAAGLYGAPRNVMTALKQNF